MTVKFQMQLKIRKPLSQVFDAVADPRKFSGYFVERASGPLAAGTTVTWKFPELDEAFPVTGVEVVKDQRLVFDWDSAIADLKTRVEITFEVMNGEETMVRISESGWPETPEGLAASHGNAGGWMFMLGCLKGYLEYGINLRAGGAF